MNVDTLHPLTLRMVFWDLNSSLGCSPLATHPYDEPPSPGFKDDNAFGVGQGTEEFLPLNPQSVALQRYLSQPRLDYGQFRLEPAITGLDWLFTPSPKLEEHLSVEPRRASTISYYGFTLPRARSTGFGSGRCDFWHFHTTLLVNCELVGFPAGTFMKLPLPQRQTPWHIIQNARCNPERQHPTIAIRFQILFTLC